MGGDIGGGGGDIDSPSTPPDIGDCGGAAGVEKGVDVVVGEKIQISIEIPAPHGSVCICS